MFWNSEWQSVQAKKSGLKNILKQKKARQRVGTALGSKYGHLNGIKNQSFNLRKTLSKQTVWFYQNSKNKKFFFMSIPPQPTFVNCKSGFYFAG